MKVSRKSWWLVAVQLMALAVLALTGPVFPEQTLPRLFLLAGLLLGLWALITIRLRNLRIVPEPAQDARITTSGPYRRIRHPMYASVLLVALGWLIAEFSFVRLGTWIVLFADLLLKLHHEESILEAAIPGYAAYKTRSYRLVPGLF